MGDPSICTPTPVFIDLGLSGPTLQNVYDQTNPVNPDIVLNGDSLGLGNLNNGILIINYPTNVAGDTHLLKLAENNGVAFPATGELDPDRPFLEVMPRNISGMRADIDRTLSNQFAFGPTTTVTASDTTVIGSGNTIDGTNGVVFGNDNHTGGASNVTIIGNDTDLSTITAPDSTTPSDRMYITKPKGLMILGDTTVGGTALPGISSISPSVTVPNVTRIPFNKTTVGAPAVNLYTLAIPFKRAYGIMIRVIGHGDAAPFSNGFGCHIHSNVINDGPPAREIGFPIVETIDDIPGCDVTLTPGASTILIDVNGLAGQTIVWNGWLDIVETNI
jgi:hypothetical protein